MPIVLDLLINYGLTRINNPYVHEYWYNAKLRKIRTSPSKVYMHFYKRNYYTHDVLGIEHTFLIRHKTGEYFPLKTWYMSYNNWIILSMHWYKPNKKKRKLNPMVDHNYLMLSNNSIGSSSLSNKIEKRNMLFFIATSQNSNILNYSF